MRRTGRKECLSRREGSEAGTEGLLPGQEGQSWGDGVRRVPGVLRDPSFMRRANRCVHPKCRGVERFSEREFRGFEICGLHVKNRQEVGGLF